MPEGVTFEQKGNILSFKGPKGSITIEIHSAMKIAHKDKELLVERQSEEAMDRSLHGLTRTLLANAVEGVKNGFKKNLEVQGVGYKAAVQGGKLVLNIGFSHPVEFVPPQGITLSIDKDNKNMVIVEGVDKQMVGQIAANIRGLKKPEPYKGKGIMYSGERIRRKAGKSAAK